MKNTSVDYLGIRLSASCALVMALALGCGLENPNGSANRANDNSQKISSSENQISIDRLVSSLQVDVRNYDVAVQDFTHLLKEIRSDFDQGLRFNAAQQLRSELRPSLILCIETTDEIQSQLLSQKAWVLADQLEEFSKKFPERKAEIQKTITRAREITENSAHQKNIWMLEYNTLVDAMNSVEPDVHLVSFEDSRLENGRTSSEFESEMNSNPKARSELEGGAVKGVVRTNLYGREIPDANIGFKLSPDSKDYFLKVQTDIHGNFETPILKPGIYFIDISKDNYVSAPTQPVEVRVGMNSEIFTPLAGPMPSGEYNIVLDWNPNSTLGLRYVDAELLSPGMDTPLNFLHEHQSFQGARLDDDEAANPGRQVITIKHIQPGTYHFYIHNYDMPSVRDALQYSRARVEVIRGQNIIWSREITPGEGSVFEFFKIKNGQIVDVMKYHDEGDLPIE